jgi:hypothetical protein
MVLNQQGEGGPPKDMQLDGWVTLQNDTGADVCAAEVDLVAGEVQLLLPGAAATHLYTVNAQIASQSGNFGSASTPAPEMFAEVKGLSVFSRFRLGRDITMTANASLGRFPLFQHIALPVEERPIFENEATAQTLGRGGFMMAPRSLEVRLVSRNQSKSPFPAGVVTIYSQDGLAPQVVGQDQIPITAETADFSVTQGRSNTLQGTRRVLSHTTMPVSPNRSKLVTQIEVVISNRGAQATTAFVREAIESYGSNSWTMTETTHGGRKLGDRMMEFRLPVPSNDRVRLVYTVECQ